MVTDIDVLVALLLLYAIAVACCWWRLPRLQSATTSVTTTVQRLLKPRSPDDCVACCLQPRRPPAAPPPGPTVRPWREVKQRRERPKQIPTDGVACLTPTCPYYRITDAQIHALVGNGAHGKTERIQTFAQRAPGQACGVTFTTRRHTPF